MEFKKLELQRDFRENIPHKSRYIPVTTYIENFDNYLNREWECHWHEEIELSVVLNGSVEYTFYSNENNTITVALSCGEGIYVPSGKLHSVKALQKGTILADLVFPINFFEVSIFNHFYLNHIKPILESKVSYVHLNSENSLDTKLIESIKEICYLNGTEIGFELYCIELISRVWRLLTEKLSHLSQANTFEESNQTQRLKEMLTFVHANYSNCISVEEIAKFVGISRTDCFRSFKKFLGKTPMEYTTNYRLSMATMMLTSTNRTLKDISSSCGFSTPEYFGKVFKKHLHMTPGQYRHQRTSFEKDKTTSIQ